MELDALKAEAEKGDASARYALAVAYRELKAGSAEEFVKQDNEVGRWLALAADQGHVQAQFELGKWHDRSVVSPSADAKRWYRAAADQGHGEACICLAELELLNRYDLASINEGVKWYRRGRELGRPHNALSLDIPGVRHRGNQAESMSVSISGFLGEARKGDVEAQFDAGCSFAHGAGNAPADLLEAYAWFRVAARELQGKNLDQLRLDIRWWEARTVFAETYAARAARILESVLNEEELARAQSLGSEYLRSYGPPIGAFQRWRIPFSSAWKALRPRR